MRRLSGIAVAMLLLVASGARAEEVVEAYRSPFGHARSVSVNHTDGSVWVAAGCSVMHLSSDGTTLAHLGGLPAPGYVSVNSTDGSCWVGHSYAEDGAWRGELVHLAAGGSELLRVGGLGEISALSVNSTDGSCWVGHAYREAGAYHSEVVHLAEDGRELLRVGGLYRVYALSVNPADGSCWVGHGYIHGEHTTIARRPDRGRQRPGSATIVWYYGEILHVDKGGAELWRGEYAGIPRSLSVSPADGSCWVTFGGGALHLAEDGTELPLTGSHDASVVSVNPADGSCWVGSGREVTHLAEDGTELVRSEGFQSAVSLSVDPRDGSCWVADSVVGADRVVHLAEDGAELWSGAGFGTPYSLLVNPADRSCWVADWTLCAVARLDEDGRALWQRSDMWWPSVEAVDPADGSCWVHCGGDVSHLAEDGTELLHIDAPGATLTGFELNPADGSWWVCEHHDNGVDIRHFSPDGTELLRVPGFGGYPVLAINPLDGSCWVGQSYWEKRESYWEEDTFHCEAIHLAQDGEELLRLEGFDLLGGPFVNPADGSCWMTQSYQDVDTGAWRGDVLHLDQDGDELLRLGGFGRLGALSVVAADGSCWVLESHWYPEDHEYEHEVVHLAQNGDELARAWRQRTNWEERNFPRLWADPVDGSCWAYQGGSHGMVAGGVTRYRGELVYLAGDGTEIWRGAGFERLSDLSIDPADGSCWVADHEAGQVVHLVVYGSGRFPDVRYSFWAHDQIRACFEAGIVAGYPDGLYHPELAVTRDQMAVYIARALEAPSGEAALADWVPAEPKDFPDVPADHWAYTHIEYCVENGVVEGCEDGLYHPEYEVTRDQMAVYVARALVAPTGEAALADYVPADPRNFPDAASDFWAYTHIEYCVEHGVVQGYEDGYYHPEIVVTRDQMAVYVARAFGLAG